MEAFVLKTLKRLRKESPRRFKELRSLCDELILALTEKAKANGGVEVSADSDADQYFEPLEAACETRNPRLMEIALDALHFLIEHGYLKGKRKLQSTAISIEEGDNEAKVSTTRTQMDAVVEAVSKCSDEFDDVVQLQVIKALLTATTSQHCEVHEASLLLAVRACFHIHLISKNQVNKTTAKAALTQMLSVVNQRMEQADNPWRESSVKQIKHADGSGGDNSTHQENVSSGDTNGLIDSENGAINGKQFVNPTQVSSHMGSTDEAGNSVNNTSSNSNVINSTFPTVHHKDTYLLFRALCKLSMKGPVSEESGGHGDHIALQNKVLSLELILNILENSGPAFRTGDKFVYAIRTYLCVSLLSNCTSQVAQVTGLALQIFLVIMHHFKEHLKSEMEVFLSTIFLGMLESENSTYDHKFRVLEVFQTICKDPSAQMELFINYDCDLEAINLFSRVVHGLAKTAKNPLLSSTSRGVAVDFMSSNGKKAMVEEQNIRTMALEGLVIVIRSLEFSLGLSLSNSSLVKLKNGLVVQHSDAPVDAALISGVVSADMSYSQEVTLNAVGAEATEDTIAHNASEDDKLDESNIGNSDTTPSPSMGSRTSSKSTLNVVDVFDRKQKFQEEIDTGILKFNLNAKKGLAYLAQLGHIEMTPSGVATFFRQYQDRLDNTVVGEYLGREREYENGFCLKVLHEYVEAMDFKDMPFDLAIRRFLSGFRLPGEAQKIDRIMEKFAERYYIQNSETFASADMAFILAFSTIMLQTNLHNPAIRDDKRMTKEQFIKQNKGISADGELSDDMLSEIYDRIAAAPISITEDDKLAKRIKRDEEKSAFVVFQASNDRRKKDAFVHERLEMVKAGEAMMKINSKRTSGTIFRNASRTDEIYVRPMFEIVWPPVIGVLSQILETYDDVQMIQLCLAGFQYCIRLACRLDVPVARNTFINALAKFTTLDTLREMKQKNVLCIKLLLGVALSDGDFLEESWLQVLQQISQLARLQLFVSGSRMDDIFFSESGTVASSTSDGSRRAHAPRHGSFMHDKTSMSDPFTKLFLGPSKAETTRMLEETNAEMVSRDIDPVQIDRIFLNSVNIGGESVRFFVKCLCEVSMLEISISSSLNSLRGKEAAMDTATPRIFSLQKLVEVADCNMYSRSRIDWANIWELLAKHFSSVGLHDNQALAMYSIDSLKQLSIKFLQKEELSNFNFQRIFLKPFEVIMQRSKYYEIKDLILRCIEIMIKACSANIHSGWRSIFAIFEVAAQQDYTEIANIAFEITEQLMNKFDLLIFDFVGIMNCLVTFVAAKHTSLSLKSLNYLSRCADHLAEGTLSSTMPNEIEVKALEKTKSLSLDEAHQISEDASVFRLWWPLLLGLSARVADARLQVRVKALNTLHTILHNYGHLFSPQTWSVIFKGVLFPMVDSATTDNTLQPQSIFPTQNPVATQNPQSWIGTMGLNVLTVSLELYQLYKQKDRIVAVLPDLVAMLEDCICQDTESLSKMGLRVLNDLALNLGVETAPHHALEQHHADLICNSITKCIKNSVCFDFGDVGFVQLPRTQVPVDIQLFAQECPIQRRRLIKDGSHSSSNILIGSKVSTPYGAGEIAAVMDPNEELGIPQRLKVMLEWGAEIYTMEENLRTGRTASYDASTMPNLSAAQSWSRLAEAAMTAMVVALEFVRVVNDLVNAHRFSWQRRHYVAFVQALEVLHWHAFAFNENTGLRFKLAEKSFMRARDKQQRLLTSPTHPHLLEQEVRSIEQILKIVYRIYNSVEFESGLAPEQTEQLALAYCDIGSAAEAWLFARAWIERFSMIALNHYLHLEESASVSRATLPGTATQTDSAKSRAEVMQRALSLNVFLHERHDSYRTCVMIVLEGVLAFSYEQFQSNRHWLLPVLARLVACENKAVRSRVKDVYENFVNPLLL